MSTLKIQPSKKYNIADATLIEVLGTQGPISASLAASNLWTYIKKHKLQDPANMREIVADKRLQSVFGKSVISMFDLGPALLTILKKASDAPSVVESARPSSVVKKVPKAKLQIKKAEIVPFAAYRAPRVSRSPKVIAATSAINQLKAEITEGLFDEFPKHKFGRTDHPENFLTLLDMCAESFDVTFKSCPPAEVDRSGSMLSGPFFTSKNYPIPTVNANMAYPLVQLDLRVASAVIGEPLGDGLLQLWHDSKQFCDAGIVRVIPRSEVKESLLTAFDLQLPDDFDEDSLAIPVWNWHSDPMGDSVQCLVGYKSRGIQCQQASLIDYANVNWSRILSKKVDEFMKPTTFNSKSKIHLFGTFLDVRYSADEVGKKCLFGLNTWGAMGNSQVFYEIDSEGVVSFEYWDGVD